MGTKSLNVEKGEKFSRILGGGNCACVRFNNQSLPLQASVRVSGTAEPVEVTSIEGAFIYRRSLAFILAAAASKLYPDCRLVIGHSIGNSYCYTIENMPPRVSLTAMVQALEAEMRKIAAADLPIALEEFSWSEAMALFSVNHQPDTAALLSCRSDPVVRINKMTAPGTDDCFQDLYIEPLVPRTGLLTTFALEPYTGSRPDGSRFILRYPGIGKTELEPFIDSPMLTRVYNEYSRWGGLMGVRSAGGLNALPSLKDFIRVCEAYQMKRLGDIAADIAARKTVRAVFIAGPSSSGKTTSAKKLSIQLKVAGLQPLALSLDNYYVRPEKTPRGDRKSVV
jgi:uridine kinase